MNLLDCRVNSNNHLAHPIIENQHIDELFGKLADVLRG